MATTSSDMRVGPVIAVSDLDRARAFYEDALGLTGGPAPGGWIVHAGQDTELYLLPGIDDAGSASWPLASFRVDDLRATVRTLRGRGVPFLGSDEVPFPIDEDGIADGTAGVQVAWIRDPDGSVLTVIELTHD